MCITKPQDILDLIKAYAHKKQEHFGVICLDGGHNVICKKVMFIGTSTKSIVGVRELLTYCLKKDCNSLIIFHNHPSGSTSPSEEDITTTERIRNGCEFVGIHFLDHVIITKNGYTSFLESNILKDKPVLKMA